MSLAWLMPALYCWVPLPGCSTLRAVICVPDHTPFWKPLLWLLGELVGREGAMCTALLPASEAVTGPLQNTHALAHGGDASKNDRAQGQVQIVLKHSNELGSGDAKEFSISAESYFVHVYCSHPIKMQLFIQSLSCRFRRCCQGEQATNLT